MSRLTETAQTTRKAIKYGSVGLVAYLVLRLVLIGTINLWKRLHPPPPPPPTVAFGKLPRIKFPLSITGNFNYTMETPSGGLPKFPDRAYVYFMNYKRANLLALDRSKKTATLLGFTGNPLAIDAETYSWAKQVPATLELRMNIITGSFTINYQWQNDESILAEKNLPGNMQVTAEAKTYLQQASLMNDELAVGESRVSYLKASVNKMIPALSLSEANFVKVDFFRKPVEEPLSTKSESFSLSSSQKLATVTPKPQDGVVSFIFSGSTDLQKRIIHLSYNYFPVAYDSWATYPLKDIATAWEEVKNGQAYIAQLKKGIENITIRKIYLAYYDNGPQEFLQPVYVFEGDNNFVTYASAIDSSWIAD